MIHEGTINAYDLGIMFGCVSAISIKSEHPELIRTAEVEADLFDVMINYWEQDEIMVKLLFSKEILNEFRTGWHEGFFDVIFPLRQYA